MAPLDPERAKKREDRLAHIAAMIDDPEYAKRHREKMRAESVERRNRQIGGRDLVAEVLSHPNPNEMRDIQIIRSALFGRACWRPDDKEMTRRITENAVQGTNDLLHLATDFETALEQMPAISDAWKLVYCDFRLIQEGESVHEAYEAQLREEERQTPKERAKELVRCEEEKTARRNARWIIPVLERLSSEELSEMEQEEGGASLAIWKQVSPASPAWVQQIVEAQQPWGFVFYKSKLVENKYGHKWKRVWEKIVESTSSISPYGDERPLSYADLDSIHCRGNRLMLRQLWTENWAPSLPASITTDDDELRKHFENYRESLSSPGILRNTFIVIDAEPVASDLWRDVNTNFDIFWVWAYDADYRPSESDAASNGEVYQGRVKVPINCLDAWFYAARWEGVSLKEMWLKAQSHPEKLWICYSKPVEAWEHESYT